MACTAVVSALVWLSAGEMTFAVNAAAFPSADRCTGPGALSPATLSARRSTAVRAEATAARSAAVRPLPLANTTVAWSLPGWPRWAACWSSRTRVEGAEAGTLAEALLLVTLARLWASGYSRTPATSQAITTGQRSRRSHTASRSLDAGRLDRRAEGDI